MKLEKNQNKNYSCWLTKTKISRKSFPKFLMEFSFYWKPMQNLKVEEDYKGLNWEAKQNIYDRIWELIIVCCRDHCTNYFTYFLIVTHVLFQTNFNLTLILVWCLFCFIKKLFLFLSSITKPTLKLIISLIICRFLFSFKLKIIPNYHYRCVSIRFLEQINSYLICLVLDSESEHSNPFITKIKAKKSVSVETECLSDMKIRMEW